MSLGKHIRRKGFGLRVFIGFLLRLENYTVFAASFCLLKFRGEVTAPQHRALGSFHVITPQGPLCSTMRCRSCGVQTQEP